MAENHKLTTTEIKQKKAKQAKTSQITGTLGLAALGATGLATKPGQKMLRGGFKRVGKPVPVHLKAEPKPPSLNRTITPMLATSAGVGSVGAFNFAQYTRAEAEKGRKVKKNYEFLDTGTYGEVAKAWEPVSRSYSPEGRREKRAKGYEAAAGAGAGATAAGAAMSHAENRQIKRKAIPKVKAANKKNAAKADFVERYSRASVKNFKAVPSAARDEVTRLRTPKKLPKVKNGRTAALAGASVVAAGTAAGVNQWRKKEFAKSAFGILHD